jgi:4-amino-4-deoxy-L-arabinose transferase-like glycosyltransferase
MGPTSSLSPARRAIWACVLLGAVVRITYWATKWGDKLQLNDSWYYSAQAHQLAHGIWFREIFVDRPGAEHGPLTSILMAPLSFGADYQSLQRLVTVATGIALIWVLGRFVEEVAGGTAGAIAALIAALYPNLWMNDGLIMSESVSMLLVALSMWAAWRAVHADQQRVRRSMAVLGVVLGLAVLARSELVMLVPLMLLWVVLVRRRATLPWRPALLVVLAAGLVVLPWVTFNLARFEDPVLLSTNDGSTLLGSNCSRTYNGAHLGGWTIFCIADDPLFVTGEEPSVRSVRQRSLGIHYALDHVGDWPKVVAARVGRSLDVYAIKDTIFQDTGEGRPKWAAWVGVVWFWILAIGALLGAQRLPRRPRSLLLLPIVVALAATVLFYGAHRIRSTAEPSLVALTAVEIAAWITASRRHREDAST